MAGEEDEAIHLGHGKWGQAGVPHKGWMLVDRNDLEDELKVCEMCESTKIRYAFTLRHTAWHEELVVGCVCAEHMTDDYTQPRRLLNEMQTSVRKRCAFPRRKGWRMSKSGNPYIKVDGYTMIVVERGDGYKVRVGDTLGSRVYRTELEARRGAYDALVWSKQKLKRPT